MIESRHFHMQVTAPTLPEYADQERLGSPIPSVRELLPDLL